jgi:uncharacterized membrane protein
MTRDLIKTLTFAVLHFSVAFAVAYLLTGSAPVATALALIEPACNTVAFFFHERVWGWLPAHFTRSRAGVGAPTG